MKVTIKSATGSNPREYKGKMFVEQQAALDIGADYPLVFKLNREQGKEYGPGSYVLSGESFATDEHGNLKIKRPQLVPVKA